MSLSDFRSSPRRWRRLRDDEDPWAFSKNVYVSGMYVIAVTSMSDEELIDALQVLSRLHSSNIPPCFFSVVEAAENRGIPGTDAARALLEKEPVDDEPPY